MPAPPHRPPERSIWSSPLLRAFRAIAVIEAVSYLVLIGTSIARRLDGPDLVPVVGLVHGIIFLVYAAIALASRPRLRWSTQRTLWVLVAAVVPFGGFVVERRLLSG